MQELSSMQPNYLLAKQRSRQGFTLIEVMIASSLLLLILGVLVNSIFNFTKTGNQMLDQSALEEQLRSALSRLEAEAIEASEVVLNEGTYTSGHNTLILKVPIYSEDGFVVLEDGLGERAADTVILNVVEDNEASPLKIQRTAAKPRKLTLTLIPHAKSNRQALTDQVIVRGLMPADAGNENKYKFPNNFGQAGSAEGTLTAPPVFQYYNQDGALSVALTTEGDTDDDEDINQVKVTLWAEINSSQRLITARKEVDVKLRNWYDREENADL